MTQKHTYGTIVGYDEDADFNKEWQISKHLRRLASVILVAGYFAFVAYVCKDDWLATYTDGHAQVQILLAVSLIGLVMYGACRTVSVLFGSRQ